MKTNKLKRGDEKNRKELIHGTQAGCECSLSQEAAVGESRNYAVSFMPLCMGSLKHLDRHMRDRYTKENSLGTCVLGAWSSAVQCAHRHF